MNYAFDRARFQPSDVGKDKVFPEDDFWKGKNKLSKECTRVPRQQCHWVRKSGCNNTSGKRRFRRFVDIDWYDQGSEDNGWDECLHVRIVLDIDSILCNPTDITHFLFPGLLLAPEEAQCAGEEVWARVETDMRGHFGAARTQGPSVLFH